MARKFAGSSINNGICYPPKIRVQDIPLVPLIDDGMGRMGHSSIQVTADIYTHLEQEDSLHVADKLNEYLSCKSENSAKSSQKVVKLAI